MEISLQQLAKRYNKEWIFKDLTYTFNTGKSYALVGANGSGKSTLLQILSGYRLASSGKIIYQSDRIEVPADEVFSFISIATPYMELIEEFTLYEHLNFHFKFRKRRENYSIEDIMKSCYLQQSRDKIVKNFSSGMKQRLKLALAFYTESDLVLLDEPTSNLDEQGIAWYQDKLTELLNTSATVIIASNQKYEYQDFCTAQVNIHDYKK
ncbi:ABC transporter, ATP-binding protein [Fulvivirga imtechensis AK7]|uniref:ABC transporter, ATP-binding protein n=1 Tax=Fulvivirga imtechensis AK7 TaxID=1237149 RepID=L8JS82_9BACT|nr:ATP-binding cassette domain-containing protein [Fulvivirga imtechensis]ELR71811.1 ABC transporter, ATP-binding protein [Fulvivirga imtechensis AK7]